MDFFRRPSEWDHENVFCFILAGGKSRRLGEDKVNTMIGDESLLELMIRKTSEIFENVAIITRRDSKLPKIDNPVLYDLMPGSGSLGGIYTGLVKSPTYFNFFLSCDMPFIEKKFIEKMISENRNFDILIPRDGRNFQPLHAIYSKACLPQIRELLAAGNLKIIDLFSKVNVRYIEKSEWEKYDKKKRMFLNINTMEDLEFARNKILGPKKK